MKGEGLAPHGDVPRLRIHQREDLPREEVVIHHEWDERGSKCGEIEQGIAPSSLKEIGDKNEKSGRESQVLYRDGYSHSDGAENRAPGRREGFVDSYSVCGEKESARKEVLKKHPSVNKSYCSKREEESEEDTSSKSELWPKVSRELEEDPSICNAGCSKNYRKE